MPRAAGADNSIYFRGREALSHAERILRVMENTHDAWNLMEMNGERCAGRQIGKLRWYDRPARQFKNERQTQ
jgi:hypothetical protein